MLDKIRQHRKDMGFSNSLSEVRYKLLTELQELIDELEIPTSKGNEKKELFDCMVMITAYCDAIGLDVDDVIDYGIMVNESRK